MPPFAPLPAFPPIDRGLTFDDSDRFFREELALAFRNRAMPLEALRYALTPTGLHFLLTHFDIPAIDLANWRLEIGGLVGEPLSLDLDAIKALPAVTRRVTMECAGNGRAAMTPRPVSQPWQDGAIGTAAWTGTPLAALLKEAAPRTGAVDVLFTGADAGMEAGAVQRYQRSLGLDDALGGSALLAYAMNGAPLEPQHGWPLRLIVPGWYGMTSVKWLRSIEVIDRRFEGHYMTGTYRYRSAADEVGTPVTRQRVRSLMVPPGIPEFFSRIRLVEAGRHRLFGRAWAGLRRVVRVEVSTDAGASWSEAVLEPPEVPGCWQAWHHDWRAAPGETTLAVRATDDAGDVQPDRSIWNVHGMGNNAVQKLPVVVR